MMHYNLRGDNSLYLFVRIARAVATFVILSFVQATLIIRYPSGVNASIQVALKLVSIPGLFTSGFSILTSSHPSSYRTFLLRPRHGYWLSIATRLLVLTCCMPMFKDLIYKIGLESLVAPLLLLLVLGVFGGEGQAYAYASKKSLGYESMMLASQLIGFVFILRELHAGLTSSAVSISVFVSLLLPRYIVDAFFSFKALPAFLLFKLPTKRTLQIYKKSLSSSVLMAIAFLNWSIDVLLVS